MRPELVPRWVEYFSSNGFPDARGLSAGMEGAVYSLVPHQLVGKVWLRKTEAELQLLKHFYDALRGAAHGVDTPQIHEIRVVDGELVTIEQYLPGVLLQTILPDDARSADPTAVRAIITVLDVLRRIPPRPELGRLHVLDEFTSPWSAAVKWSEAISTIIDRRIVRFGDQLARVVPNFADVCDAVHTFLRTRDSAPMGLIHGDLCGANIMIDTNASPLSVFDFGFFSTVGDPAFDASISGAIFNMYGEHARSIDDHVTALVANAFDYTPSVLLSYRAVYAILTSNAYSPEGLDGHFRWSIAMLCRDDVQAALGL